MAMRTEPERNKNQLSIGHSCAGLWPKRIPTYPTLQILYNLFILPHLRFES
jgi:hypothetical protein